MNARAENTNRVTPVDTLLRSVPPSGSTASSLGAQVRLLVLLGSASPFNELLDGLARYVESWADGLLCTVLLVDPVAQVLVPGSAPSLPQSYVDAINPVPIKDGRGSCGTAAANRAMVVVDDVRTSPLWADSRHIALAHGLMACWSVPILDDAGELLGTLAMYYREPRAPSAEETDLIKFAGALAGFVIQRHRDAAKLRSSEARLEAAVAGTELGVWDGDIHADYCWTNDWCERLDIDPCNGPDSLRRWRAQIHPEDVGRYVRCGDDTISGAVDHYVIEYRVRTRSGSWRWVHERGRVTERDQEGKAKHYVGVCIDIEPRKRLETALRNAEDRYELAVGAAQLPVWEYDVASDAVTGNVYWHRTLGYDVTEEATERRVEQWLSDVHPDDAARHHRVFASDSADANGYYQAEFRMRTASGHYKWLLDRGRVVERDADGAPTKVVGVSIDIDERKAMEAAVRSSEERFRSAFEFAAIGMALVGTDGRWLRVNASLCQIVGYTAEELLGSTFQAITHAEDLAADIGNAERLLAGSLSHYDVEKRYIHKSGHVVWVFLSVSLARGPAGEPLYFIAQIQDITQRKDAEQRLIESELRYRTTADLVPGFVFEGEIRAGQVRPTWVSNGFEKFYGCSLEEWIGLGGRQFNDASASGNFLAAASWAADGAGLDVELSLRDRNGEQRWLHVVAKAERGPPGVTPERVVGVATDITARKRLEMALGEAMHQEQQRLGKEMHDGLGQELAGLAYLVSSLANEAARIHSPLAGDLARIATVAGHTIETCRDIARGVSPLTESRGSLVESLRRIADIAAARNHARIDFEAIENAPITLPAETLDHLHRIAQEAMTNALKHSGATTIRVAITIEPALVRIEVLDDGRGFGSAAGRSTGLGLDSMRQRAAAIGAQLRIRTQRRGGGSVVCECPQAVVS